MEGLKNLINILFIGGLIFAVICGIITGILQHEYTHKVSACRSQTTGTVVSIEKSLGIINGIGPTKWRAEYVIDGKTYTAEGVYMRGTAVGDSVTVNYDHFEPDEGYIGSEPSEKADRSFIGSFGIGLAVLSFAMKANPRGRRIWTG